MHVVNFCLNILSCRIISQTSDDVHLNSNCIQCYQCKPFMWQPNEHGSCAQMKAMYQQWQLCHDSSLPVTAVESTFLLTLIINHALISEPLKCEQAMHLHMIGMVARQFSKGGWVQNNYRKTKCFFFEQAVKKIHFILWKLKNYAKWLYYYNICVVLL